MLRIYNKYEMLLCFIINFVVVDNITSSVQIGYQKDVKLFTIF